MNLEQKLEELKKRDRMAAEGGGTQRRERQHKEGKMSARERVEFLLDEGSFEETDRLVTHRSTDFGMQEQVYFGDGFVTGYGRVAGRLCRYLSAQHAGVGRHPADFGHHGAVRRRRGLFPRHHRFYFHGG